MELHLDSHAPGITDLPWELPLEEWPDEILSGLPRGISRHIVRFIEAEDVLAIKETQDAQAKREFELLQALRAMDVPAVQPVGYVTGRVDAQGQELPGALLTAHLRFSLPYRALFSRSLAQDNAHRLVDALAVLLVRLHLSGFFWGDVSLSNALFRRDADAYAAYLVDAETGELHDSLSPGQREYDLDIAQLNIAGDFLDLQAGGLVAPDVDPLAVSKRLLERYQTLWSELTATEEFSIDDRWRIDERIRRLNAVGFDLGELTVTTDLDGVTTRIEPKIVAPNFHSTRLLRLTGIGAADNQARRMLNDLDAYRSATGLHDVPEEDVAKHWLHDVYLPVVRAVPAEYANRLESGQVFHEFLDHRWYMAENSQSDVPTPVAIDSYVRTVLAKHRDEANFLRKPGEDTELTERTADT